MTEYDDHIHKFFIFQVKADFSPATDYLYSSEDKDHRTLYERVEYAILGCNCGKVVKTKVIEQ